MLWTELHAYTLIPEFIVFIVGAFILSRVLKNKSFETQMLPLKICTILLLALEVAKQIVGIVKGYETYWIPLHFCSLFLYFYPIACFYKGKHRDKFLLISGIVSACLFLFMAVYPNLIYSDDAIRSMWAFVTGKGGSFFELHTVLFHGIALFTFFLFAFQGLAKFNIKKDYLVILITFGAYCLIVGVLAQIIDTNFNNFVRSNAPFLEDIRQNLINNLGGFFGQTVYVVIVSVGTIIVPFIGYFLLYGLTTLFNKMFNKEKPTEN